MAEPKESDDEVVKLNSSPPDDGYDGPTRIGEDAYKRLARGMLNSPEPPPSAGPPPSFSRPPDAPTSPKAAPRNVPHDPKEAGAVLAAPPAPAPSAAPPAAPPSPSAEAPRAIRADIVVAVGAFFLVVVAALIYLYFRELMKH